MAFDFPAGPIIGDEYAAAGVIYRWNGYCWLHMGSDGSTPPPPGGVGNDGEALVAQGGAAVWGAPIEGGNF